MLKYVFFYFKRVLVGSGANEHDSEGLMRDSSRLCWMVIKKLPADN